ncbi:MAG: hypothetical protein WC979_01575 [Candidatus Pacearchaeota archaeon]|jgi:hypothetical protein|nr:hypothetical protein [Clostridia bacterium]
MELKIFKLNRIKFDEMYKDAIHYLADTYQQSGQVFSVASPYGQLLQVILNMGQLMFYYIEDSITELNIQTATRKNSIYGAARLTGHNPTRAIAATGTIRVTYKESVDMYGNPLIIPNFSKVACKENGLPYTIFLPSEDTRLLMEPRSFFIANVKQGEIETQRRYGDGDKLFSFNVVPAKGKDIDMHEVKVFVNSEEWQIYDSLSDMSYGTKGCIVKTSLTEGIDVFFGNGYYGAIPGYGVEIKIQYLVTAGGEGNIGTSNASGWTFDSVGYDALGNEVTMTDAVTVTAETSISFGSASEPTNLTQLIAPHNSRNYVLANTVNYEYFLEKFNYFSYIDAYTTFNDSNPADDNVVYLFLVPDINKRKRANENYFNVPQSNFLLSEDEKKKIYDLIEQSGQKVLTVVNQIIDPIVKRYAINISLITFENYSTDLIKDQIVSKLSDYLLKNQRRDRIPKSDLIAIIENIEGVDSVNIWFVSEENEQSKANDINAQDLGLDEFGDIIVTRNEMPLIRGGWKDRNGIVINDVIDNSKPGPVNIIFEKITPKSYSATKHQANMDKLKK